MRVAERGTVDAAFSGRAELRERVERAAHAVGVDAEGFRPIRHCLWENETGLEAD
jgi:hypothetical protein